jgi:hypothetical protein
VVVNVGFSTMLALHVLVRDVHVLYGGMVVIVRMSGQQVSPVLTLMEIVGHVVVLVTVLDAVVLVMTLRSRHPAPPPGYPHPPIDPSWRGLVDGHERI